MNDALRYKEFGMTDIKKNSIKAIVGLGNPGKAYYHQRHSIGFRVVDLLASRADVAWQQEGNLMYAKISIKGVPVMLIKPQTFMNTSGDITPWMKKRGLTWDEALIVHDELELPFGECKWRIGGSHRGHNGVRSIIAHGGQNAARLRFGIGRPEQKEQVPDYVLSPFDVPAERLDIAIATAADMIEMLYVESFL